jgi:CRP-like cAMP-binding protein
MHFLESWTNYSSSKEINVRMWIVPHHFNWRGISMADELELIRKIDFFQALEPKILKKVAEVCIPKNYAAGDYLIRQGETGLGLFFVVNGELKVEIERGSHRTVVATLKDEDFVGELAVIDNKPRSANVICVKDTKCLVLTRDSFLKLMNGYPQIAIQMAKSLSERLRTTDDILHRRIEGAGSVETPVGATVTSSTVPDASEETSRAPTDGQENQAPKAGNGSSKDRVRDFLVDTFSRFYTVKAMTRFSVAVVGCPIRIEPGPNAYAAATGDVKLLVLSDSHAHDIPMEATGNGDFSVTVLQPQVKGASPGFSKMRFDGEVRRGQRLRLHIPPRGRYHPWLSRMKRCSGIESI